MEWMCEYNQGKPEEEKVHYMGIDCQSNKYNTELIYDYLKEANVSSSSFADSILNVAKSATDNDFSSYDYKSFKKYMDKLKALKDSINNCKNKLIENSSEKEYQLHARMVEVVRANFQSK